jgi:hypothetical protein
MKEARAKPEKIASEELSFDFWKTADGYVLSVYVFWGTFGEKYVSISLAEEEALQLRADSELLRLKVRAISVNTDLFKNEIIDFISPE